MTAEKLRVITRAQVSAEAWASPLAERPRIQHTDIIRQRLLAILAQDADVAPMRVDVLRSGIGKGIIDNIFPVAFVPGTSQFVLLLFGNVPTSAVVTVTVDTLPEQLETTISTSRGGHCLSNPAFRIGCYLLINPTLQASLINSGPFATT